MGPSYPYGGSYGNAPNPLAQFQGNQVASTLPAPSPIKPRQNSTVEHRNALLSIFGKSQLDTEQGKGKESMASEPVASPGSTPRSRLASFASQGSRRESRRNSATPLSSADRNFLLGFLENVSHNSKS
jgi:mRNA-decapping enzyme subunit 2